MDDDEKTVVARRTSRVAPGVRLNGIYQIDGLIAIGGMSEIYKGHNIQTMDEVAIKVILPEFANDEQMVALFRREALTLNRLSHETIIRYHVFSQDQAANLLYLAMEFVDGPTLRESMRQRPLTQLEACTLIRKVAEGMQAAHAEGVIHRDISTDNIVLANNDVSKPKVIDFGIARSTDTSDSTLISSGFAGKYSFVSPEQLGLFGGHVRETSDIYSLGLVFAAALRGRALDMAGSHADVVMKRQSVPDLSMINPGVKPLIEKMLQPNPIRRPQSMAAVAAALDPLIPQEREQTQRGARPVRATVSQPPSSAPLPSASASRAPLGAMALLALIGGGLWYGASQTEAGRSAFANLTKIVSAPASKETKTETAKINPKSGKSELKAGDDSAPEMASAQPDPQPAPDEAPPAAAEADPAPVPPAEAKPAEPPPAAQEEQQAAITPPKPPQAAAKDDPATWVSAFDGGTCFLAIGRGGADGPVSIEGFGDRLEPFEELNRRFKDAYGIEPEIGLRSVTKQQCPVIEFARRTAGPGSRMAFALKSDVLQRGQKLDAKISGGAVGNIGIFVVTPDGLMVNVSALAERSGDESAIQIPYEAFASKAGDAYLLLAVSSENALPAFERGKAREMAAFFEALRQGQEEGGINAAVKFVRKR
jgi:eukaryotic-like serine/threonine-protein kinase